MYTNVVKHCNCQSQDHFSTLNITLRSCKKEPLAIQSVSYYLFLHPDFWGLTNVQVLSSSLISIDTRKSIFTSQY